MREIKIKKIIDGKTYNTETADHVAHYWNGLGSGDFGNFSESLYRTKKGAWFTAGFGGAMTKYSVSCGNMRSGGDGLAPITDDEAMRWLENYGEVEALEKYFSDKIEEA